MLDAFISGFWQTVAWPAFGYMLIGIGIGFLSACYPVLADCRRWR